MRLNLENGVIEPATERLVVTGIIDWSTIAQFRAGLSRCAAGPRPNILVDVTGLLSWSPEAQDVVQYATTEARLHGGRLEVFGLPPIPAWEARRGGPRDLEPAAQRSWWAAPRPVTTRAR